MIRPAFLALLAIAIAHPATAQSSSAADRNIRAVSASAPYQRASEAIEAGHDRWVADIIAITQIPAPPFKEEARAKAYADMLRSRGLADVEIDEAGNAIGLWKGSGGENRKLLVVSAHLDTVFPEGTDVTVRREGEKLFAPGVGDDSAGLATILSLVEAMKAGKVTTQSDILFVGTVGEEGLGDLRGVRHLLTKGRYKDRVGGFISIDGSGTDAIVTAGTGSKRYRLRYKGPGGHSYGAFGIVNPMAALGRTVVDMYAIDVPDSPRTTYSASVVGGGTSVNSIPEDVWLEIDMRSEDSAELDRLEQRVLAVADRSIEQENAARSTENGKVTLVKEKIGDRPAGRTSPDADLVRLAEAAFRSEGIIVKRTASSTDSNMAMSLGIPAITLPRSTSGGRGHAPDEWIGVEKSANVQLRRILLAAILAEANRR